MPLTFNLRQLEGKNLLLKGELPSAELDLEGLDELIHCRSPLTYELEVEKLERAILIMGELGLMLECECARCLKAFPHPLTIERWACHLPLEGEEQARILNDCVDLTPYLREDIVLALPQHPLCKTECRGLAGPQPELGKGGEGESQAISSAWAELNKLKL